jgi:MFS family permease
MDLRHQQRISLSVFFFLSGICFSSWASRIPTIKANFGFNDAELGTILLCMPISSLIGLPISGWLVSRYDSRIPLAFAFFLLAISLTGIGFATNTFLLVASVGFFSFSMRILNISMNTQAITLQKQFDKKINGSFHGLWSTGGIAGVSFTTLLVWLDVDIRVHLLIVAALTMVTTVIAYQTLMKNDRASSGNKLVLGKPDPYIVYLGLLVFFAAICEGGMFDWSGVYFKDVVNEKIFTLGYLLFVMCMAVSRFASDYIIDKFGMPKTYIVSALLLVCGVCLAVIFPFFWTSLIGFCLVGFGAASIIPMTFLLAGGSRKYSPGMAISIIATYSIVGMLVGPPMIGYIAQALNLRVSFVVFALSGLMLIPISQFFFKYQKSLEQNT